MEELKQKKSGAKVKKYAKSFSGKTVCCITGRYFPDCPNCQILQTEWN
jgi:hypothetical protein